jgi:hypothetical protein
VRRDHCRDTAKEQGSHRRIPRRNIEPFHGKAPDRHMAGGVTQPELPNRLKLFVTAH